MRRLLHETQQPWPNTVADYHWETIPDLDGSQTQQLAHDTGWLDRSKNLHLVGPNGVGKTKLASGICRSLNALDLSAPLITGTALMQHMEQAKADCALAKELIILDHYALLVINDIGYVRKDESETSLLFELAMRRYERLSRLITSKQLMGEWEKMFPISVRTIAHPAVRAVASCRCWPPNGRWLARRYGRVRSMALMPAAFTNTDRWPAVAPFLASAGSCEPLQLCRARSAPGAGSS